MWSIKAASVVDLPEPVGPVTSTSPFVRSQRSSTLLGSPSSSGVRIWNGIARKTAPGPRRSRKRFARKREAPAMACAKSVSLRRSNAAGIDRHPRRQDLFDHGDEPRVRRRLRRVALACGESELDLLAALDERGLRSEAGHGLEKLIDLRHAPIRIR